MPEVVFLNGNFLEPQEAKVSVMEAGFLYGLGLFETMRAYRKKIVYFAAHLARLQDSSRLISLNLPYPPGKIKKIIQAAIEKSHFSDAYIRLNIWKESSGAAIALIVKEYKPPLAREYIRGVKATVSSFRQSENYFFSKIKSANRLLYEISYLQAKKKGFDGSIILNNRGYVTEASRNNIFFAKDNVLYTPAISCGCLPGVTRKVVFDLARKSGIEAYEGNFTLGDLCFSQEVFFTSSLSGIMPVTAIDKNIIGKGKCGKITKLLIEKYHCLLK